MSNDTEALPLFIDDLRTVGDNNFQLQIPGLTLTFGDVLGVVGTNGSGKTSFIESVLGLRSRLTGSVKLFGTDLSTTAKSASSLRRIGVQLQTVCYSENFKVIEIVDLHRLMYQKVDEMVAKSLGIAELYKHSYGKLSRGQKQRVDIYVALAHQPDLVFLDEPSTGLDQGYQANFARLLARRARNMHTATIISSHSSDEILACNRVLWLKAGAVHQIIERGKDMQNLRQLISCKLRIKIKPEHVDETIHLISANSAVLHYERQDNRTVLAFGDERLHALAAQLKEQNFILETESYEADASDFLLVVTRDSERK